MTGNDINYSYPNQMNQNLGLMESAPKQGVWEMQMSTWIVDEDQKCLPQWLIYEREKAVVDKDER